MQITMLAHLTAIFGISLDISQVVSLLAGIGGTGSATYFGKMIVSSLFKWIPGLGTISGGVVTGMTASTMTIALAYSYIEVMRQITKAEMSGRNLRLRELQQLMNKSFETHLKEVSKFLPDSVREKLLPEWFQDFLTKR